MMVGLRPICKGLKCHETGEPKLKPHQADGYAGVTPAFLVGAF